MTGQDRRMKRGGGSLLVMLHGPNLNMLGNRSEQHYRGLNLEQIESTVRGETESRGWLCACHQTNHEGTFIELVHEYLEAEALLVNPGAWTHYNYAIRDALEMAKGPLAEVHISNIYEREAWRAQSVIEDIADVRVWGKGLMSYLEAVRELIHIAGKREGTGG